MENDTPLVQFEWRVPGAGFTWEKKGVEACLVLKTPAADKDLLYAPLQAAPALFRNFAALDGTADSFLRFANEYGRLKLGPKMVEPSARPHLPFGREPLRGWQNAHRQLAHAVELWQLIEHRRPRELASRIKWQSKRVTYQSNVGECSFSETDSPHVFTKLRRPDLLVPARYFLQDIINKHFREHGLASPRLLWEQKKLKLFLMPDSLIGAMWLQLAQAIDGDRKFRRCTVCGTWFAQSPGVGRSDKRYCSNACRTTQWRRKPK